MNMDLKNATAVCLISFVSATLVLLIAQALDVRAASRLEPQLARIVEELEAIRRQGGLPAGAATTAEPSTDADALVVYYFYSNTRCATCRAIEAQAHQAVQSSFVAELAEGSVEWKTLNYEQPAGAELAKQFEIQMPMVVLAQYRKGQLDRWKRLEQVWALVDDEPAFLEFVRQEVAAMLEAGTADGDPTAVPPTDLPVPEAALPELPVPDAPDSGAAALPAGGVPARDEEPMP